jgi:hypothetical protein
VTSASTILICPTVQLQRLPVGERDVLRRFFTMHLVGMDPENDRRWRRFVRDLFNAEAGEGFQILRYEERGGPYHRMHRAFLTRLYDSQERYRLKDKLHAWLKLGAGFVEWQEGREPGTLWPRPRSTAFHKCSEDEIREFHDAAVDYLRTERAQRFLWRHLKSDQRMAMLEAVLEGDPERDQP